VRGYAPYALHDMIAYVWLLYLHVFDMLGRAELAFIVINIAYTKSHLITLEQFYTLILTLFLLNVTVPALIKWWKPYYKGSKSLTVFGVTLSKN